MVLSKSAPSGSSASASTSALTPYAKKLPRKPKGPNQVVNGDNEAKHGMLMEIISTCQLDYDYIQQLYSKMRERQRSATSDAKDGMEFRAVSTLGGLDPDWVVDWVSGKSDMTVEEIVGAMESCQQAPYQMLAFAVQHPLTMKWPEQLRGQDDTGKWFDVRFDECGTRLRGFKASGGLAPDGKVDWSKGSYRPRFCEKNRLKEIEHANEDVITVPAHINIYKGSFSLDFNWDDWLACFVVPLMRDTPVHSLFKAEGKGPYKYRCFQKKPAEFTRALQACADGFEEEEAKLFGD